MPRNRAQTEQRLIDAVGQLLLEEGIEAVRINRIATRAGVNKILIYRYFGGLTGLRDAYMRQAKPAASPPGLNIDALRSAPLDVVFDACCEYAISEYRLLRQNPEAQAYLRATLMEPFGASNPAIFEKEFHYQAMVDELALLLNTKQGRSFAAIINSAMTLLTFLTHQKRTVFGLDLSHDDAWDDLETAIRNLFRGAYLYTKERQEREPTNAKQAGQDSSTLFIEKP